MTERKYRYGITQDQIDYALHHVDRLRKQLACVENQLTEEGEFSDPCYADEQAKYVMDIATDLLIACDRIRERMRVALNVPLNGDK